MAIKYRIIESDEIQNREDDPQEYENSSEQDRNIKFEFNPTSGEESLSCQTGKDASEADLVLSSAAVVLGVYQALRRSSGEEDAEIMRRHLTELVNNPSFWDYSSHQDDAIDFSNMKTYRS